MLEARGPILEARGPYLEDFWDFYDFGGAPATKNSSLLGTNFAQVGAKFELSWAIVVKKVFQNTLAKPIAFKHRFLKKFGLPGVSPDMKKQAKPLYCCSFSGFPPKWKKLLWRGVWGSILEAFWGPSWAMLGTKLA